MFTGIIEGLGTIAAIEPAGQGRRIAVAADFDLAGTRVGDSIAVNGACLTAVVIHGRRFQADVSPETLRKTTFAHIRRGDRVNLERALRLSDRLDGHLVSGHIDGTGVVRRCRPDANAVIVAIEVPGELARYLIPKGSVAVDGVSLTINACDSGSFEVSIIPHTAGLTTVGIKTAGQAVNIETDVIAKYIERFLLHRSGDPTPSGAQPPEGGIDLQLLARTGFL